MERLEIEDVSNLLVRQNVGREWDRVWSMGKDAPSKWTLPYTVRELLEGKDTTEKEIRVIEETLQKSMEQIARTMYLKGLYDGVWGEVEIAQMVLRYAYKANPCVMGVEIPYSPLDIQCIKPWDFEWMMKKE